MIEKIIQLGSIEPLNIFGTNNSKLELIKTFFPKLKIIARGDFVKVLGNEDEVSIFGTKFNQLILHFERFNSLPEARIEKILSDCEEELARDNAIAESLLIHGNNGKPIKPRTPGQHKMIEKSVDNDLLFAIGPAGTGKTYVAIALAVRALRYREVKKIILSRPAVEAGENLGFLPGDLKDKLDPYLLPLYDALNDMIPTKKLNDFMEEKIIEIAPLGFMRGRTLSNAFVILDEAQNATNNQLKMFLTRMGENSKFVVTGDLTQIDLKNKADSGLFHAQKILSNINGVAVVNFNANDVVRHKLVQHIVNAYEKESYSSESSN